MSGIRAWRSLAVSICHQVERVGGAPWDVRGGAAAAHGEASRAHERRLVLADRLGVEIGRGRVELARLKGAKLAREDVVEDVVHVHLRKGGGEEEEASEGARGWIIWGVRRARSATPQTRPLCWSQRRSARFEGGLGMRIR